MDSSQPESFWNWFIENQSQYLFIKQVNEGERNRLLNTFLDKLHSYNENLYFEIGGNSIEHKVDLVISADGIIEHFDSVEKLVNKAPNLTDWNIIAFKPPKPEDTTLEVDGISFDAQKIIFIPLTSDDAPGSVAIRVCFAEFNEDQIELYTSATFLLLDALIGEKETALKIDYLDVVKTPENINDYPFLHLSNISDYIKEIKGAVNN
ncbi:MAG: hypothetical protein ACPGLV_11640 [Bacteroidia bacterium]